MQEKKLGEIVDFSHLTDEEVVRRIQQTKDPKALEYMVHKYRNLVRAKARTYFLIGADREDIYQEGLIGLYKATRDFATDKQASFRAFAELCVTRQIITAIKTATRQKHGPLNYYVSLNKPVYDEQSERTLLDMIGAHQITDPEELVIVEEAYDDMERFLQLKLTDLEWEVLTSYLDGLSYQEMAKEMRCTQKSIDNALQRIKRKVKKYIMDRNREEF